MAGPTLSRFLGLFRLRDASDPTRLAAVSAAGAVKGEGAGVAGTPAGGVMTVQGVAAMRPVDIYAIDPQTGERYDPTAPVSVVLPKSTTFVTAQTSVGTTLGGTKLFNLNGNAVDRLVRCITQDMYIGPVGVTALTGFLIKKDEPPIRWPASVGEVYGITATGTATAFTFEE
ncbi:hypothetical protein [Reyranella sp.]|uniref:hypothetical protein n=1 Tax=Reyranella sp. TaxID=1929291 RepID=UPI003C7E2B3F